DCFDAFGAPEWFVHKEFANIVPTRFTNHEIISMYVLKSYLHQFRNTAIAKDTESLLKKLENAAQGEEVVSMSLEHAFGQYHYDYDNTMIERVVEKIRLRSSMSVTYRNAAGQVKTYDVQLCRVFHYNGELYVAAYIFKHSTYSTLALRNIQQLEDSAIEYPAHRFNEQEFLRTRFGVYHGTPVDITLQVRADMSEFFRNRTWHPTQKITVNEDNTALITMTVPIQPDLVSWIAGWSPYLTVVSPKNLRQQVVERLIEGAVANDA
ncbi:MAG: helix-turn-helix transcriptional regulator, partial [Candidatus Kapaibacterium sp.]